jgi:hypothetical protein
MGVCSNRRKVLDMDETRTDETVTEARRRFLATCGRFAIVTPPAVALLLAAGDRKYAVAASGGPQGNNGFGNGGGDGVPGNSGFEDVDR